MPLAPGTAWRVVIGSGFLTGRGPGAEVSRLPMLCRMKYVGSICTPQSVQDIELAADQSVILYKDGSPTREFRSVDQAMSFRSSHPDFEFHSIYEFRKGRWEMI